MKRRKDVRESQGRRTGCKRGSTGRERESTTRHRESTGRRTGRKRESTGEKRASNQEAVEDTAGAYLRSMPAPLRYEVETHYSPNCREGLFSETRVQCPRHYAVRPGQRAALRPGSRHTM